MTQGDRSAKEARDELRDLVIDPSLLGVPNNPGEGRIPDVQRCARFLVVLPMNAPSQMGGRIMLRQQRRENIDTDPLRLASSRTMPDAEVVRQLVRQ